MPEHPRVTITVPWDAGLLTANQRLHWARRARITNAAKGQAVLAWKRAGRPTLKGAVIVNITIRRGRILDNDNAIAGCKALFDSLFGRQGGGKRGHRWKVQPGRVTPDDSAAYVTIGTVTQETGKGWKARPEVVFEIEPGLPK